MRRFLLRLRKQQKLVQVQTRKIQKTVFLPDFQETWRGCFYYCIQSMDVDFAFSLLIQHFHYTAKRTYTFCMHMLTERHQKIFDKIKPGIIFWSYPGDTE